MVWLIAGSALFVLVHLGISGTPVRQMVIDGMGESPYLGIYSVLSLVGIGLMVYGYNGVVHTDFIWLTGPMGLKASKALMVLSMLFLGCGFFAKNPTMVQNEKALSEEVSGILKVTRHPIQWAILLYCLAHLNANGDVASIMLFGSIAVVSLAGMFAMDARHRRQADPLWQQFMSVTSMLPFAAIASGRTSFSVADIPWTGLGAGAVTYVAAYWFHGFLSGGVPLI